MPSLRRVLQPVAFWLYRDEITVDGEMTGANNANPTSQKFKGCVAVTRTGEGVYRFTLLADDGTSARKGFSLKSIEFLFTTPAAADGGSGPKPEMTTDSLNASGFFDITMRNLAGTAADFLVLCKVTMRISPEANAA